MTFEGGGRSILEERCTRMEQKRVEGNASWEGVSVWRLEPAGDHIVSHGVGVCAGGDPSMCVGGIKKVTDLRKENEGPKE